MGGLRPQLGIIRLLSSRGECSLHSSFYIVLIPIYSGIDIDMLPVASDER